MIIYSGTKQNFIDDVVNDRIAGQIEKLIYEKMGKRTLSNEFKSWDNSLQYMEKVLNDSEIPDDVGIAIEYNVPQTAKRVDFIVSGYDNVGFSNVVIIELKQWTELSAVESSNALVEKVITYTGGALRQVVHPSYQAWSYAQLIKDYNKTVQDENINIRPCSYLHNYRRKDLNDPIDDERYKEYLDNAPAFTKGEALKLRSFIKCFIHKGDNIDLIYRIDGGKIHPSKSLQDSIASMMQGNQEFIMIDDQRCVYEDILKTSQKCQKDGKKRTVIVEGGPGTGKTVVAINLLAQLTRLDQVVQYTSKNSAPREVYAQKLARTMKKTSVTNLFKGSGCYYEAERNVIDTILCDEAHRLNEKSGLFSNKGENQIKEIIHASKCSVFFIDESQRVTMKDIGSVEEIEKWAKRENSEVTKMELTSQFRCDGSDGYLAWLDDVLQIRETANKDIGELNYDFRVCDTPQEMVDLIKERNKEDGKSRVVAGYCWEWPKEGQSNPDFHDIKIGDFEMSWNLANYTFALNDESINQAGCIHSTQGLEFSYVGVIIGNDLRSLGGKVFTDYEQRASTDQSIKGLKKLISENPEVGYAKADEIIKNTYRTLMSRGMKGCYVYCCNEGLAQYLKDRMPKEKAETIRRLPGATVTADEVENEPETIIYPQPDMSERDAVWIPLVGEIAAGHEHFMEDDIEGFIKTDPSIASKGEAEKYFYLRVSGDSMIGKDINDGDIVLIRKTSKPQNGDIVACMLHNEFATLKTFYKDSEGITLEPANPAFDPIHLPWLDFYDGSATILGVMKDIIKP
ncbi:MAG: DUF2075 domain-containing protein [Clostridia bacterium]|nr:DUF2075 domain-containing protein [Clostridia bacterium]